MYLCIKIYVLHQIMILDKIDKLLKEVQNLSAKNADEVEQLRLKYLSKKGEITALMNDFRNVAADEKKTVGMKINELKTLATERINQLREECATQDTGDADIDLTRTPYPIQLGTRHPLTIVTNEIIDIFSRMGFVLADGPEVEDDLHVFTKMNFAADHPARDMQDTFFVLQHPNDVTKNILLRSHTSSVQARVMEQMHTEDGNLTAPIRVICPGRVYRNEAITARAHCFFHQVEGLYIDKNVSFTDLKQVLLSFAREMFGPDTQIRLRPSYFPFTEPSAEMDISCFICGGEGCGFCKHTGWVEILGCGMVDPNVLEECGIDSKEYSGYGNVFFIAEDLSLGTFVMPVYAGVYNENTYAMTGDESYDAKKGGSSMWWKNTTDADGNATKVTTTTYSDATDYVIDDNVLPKLYGGFNTNFELYGFDLGLDFAYQIGGKVYDNDYASFMGSPLASSSTRGQSMHADLLNAWSASNTGSDIPRLQYGDQYSNGRSTRFLTKASYLSLQNLSFGYTLPSTVLRKAHIDRVRIYLNASNVWLWSKRQGLDPRTAAYGVSSRGESNASYYSIVRTISAGATITF